MTNIYNCAIGAACPTKIPNLLQSVVNLGWWLKLHKRNRSAFQKISPNQMAAGKRLPPPLIDCQCQLCIEFLVKLQLAAQRFKFQRLEVLVGSFSGYSLYRLSRWPGAVTRSDDKDDVEQNKERWTVKNIVFTNTKNTVKIHHTLETDRSQHYPNITSK